jgi:hypothetical protein
MERSPNRVFFCFKFILCVFESGHTPSRQECLGVGEIFVHFYPTHTVIRNLIFTNRLASLGGTIINLVVDKTYVWREETARHAVHYLGGH